jgi:hypothetical protein
MAENKDWKSTEVWNNKNEKEIDKLFNLYKKDKKSARTVFMSGDYNRFSYNKVWLFEDPDSDEFDFVWFRVRHGISVTNKIYTHKKRIKTFRYREKNGFWVSVGRSIRRPIDLSPFEYGDVNKYLQMYMAGKFTWYRCMVENHLNFDKNFTLHTVWNKKLFNLSKLLKAHYGVPIQTAKKLHEHRIKALVDGNLNHMSQLLVSFKKDRRFIKNIENLQDWHFDVDYLLRDSIDMARKLDKVVNLSWSQKRLHKEHDDWAEELTQILFIDDNKALSIKGVYKLFAAYSKYYMIKTTRGLAMEGKKQSHCVGGYGNSVNNGTCAIYHIKGYTLDIRLKSCDVEGEEVGAWVSNRSGNPQKLYINQFRGYGNKNAPDELRDEVQAKIDEFNAEFKEHESLTSSWYNFDNDSDHNRLGNFNITTGAEDYEIFDLDNLDEDGEPTQILVDETIRPNWIIEGDDEIAELFEDNQLNGDDILPF